MMGRRQVEQADLFYEFSLENHVPADHLLRSIDRFVDLGAVRQELAPFYSSIGRPSIDPELMIRMLIVGYCCGIRSERRLCEEVHLNLACRWFCRLGLDGDVPDHATFAVDASLIKADANRQNGIEGEKGLPSEAAGRAIDEYLAVLDDAAFGAATEVTPKFVRLPIQQPAGPARTVGKHSSPTPLITWSMSRTRSLSMSRRQAIRQAEVVAAKRMIERSIERFDLYPRCLLGDSAYGSAEMLGWLVYEHGIEPHVTVFDKSARA